MAQSVVPTGVKQNDVMGKINGTVIDSGVISVTGYRSHTVGKTLLGLYAAITCCIFLQFFTVIVVMARVAW